MATHITAAATTAASASTTTTTTTTTTTSTTKTATLTTRSIATIRTQPEAKPFSSAKRPREEEDSGQHEKAPPRSTKVRPTTAATRDMMDPPVVSFYTRNVVPLPSRFRGIKQRLISGREDAVAASWSRLLAALRDEVQLIEARGSDATDLIPSIGFDEIGGKSPEQEAAFSDALKRHGLGVIRGVVPREDALRWVRQTEEYLYAKTTTSPKEREGSDGDQAGSQRAPPAPAPAPAPAQDPTCFDFFWTPAQVRARAHPHVLTAQRFAMSLWDAGPDDARLATRFPITYADRIRIESISQGGSDIDLAASVEGQSHPASPVATTHKTPEETIIAAAAATSSAQMAQVDNGSLERWEPDGYGRAGLYDAVWRGEWESWNPWDPAGRIGATPDLYNGAGACSMMRLFQGILALTVVEPGMIKLLPSPKLSTVYFLLRPFFSPINAAPEDDLGEGEGDQGTPASRKEKWDAYLDPSNWRLDRDQSTIIHGAVPGHAQRVTDFWHPHLELAKTLVAPPTLQPGDYIIWHPETAYQFSNTYSSRDIDTRLSVSSSPTAVNPVSTGGTVNPSVPQSSSSSTPSKDLLDQPRTSMLVYVPAAPLSQTNALFLARQRKAFLRGQPGPDFDSAGGGSGSGGSGNGNGGSNGGSGLGRPPPCEGDIRNAGGDEALQAMGLAPFNLGDAVEGASVAVPPSPPDGKSQGGAARRPGKEGEEAEEGEGGRKTGAAANAGGPTPRTRAEVEVLKLANVILFPERYEFYMPTRASTPAPVQAPAPPAAGAGAGVTAVVE